MPQKFKFCEYFNGILMLSLNIKHHSSARLLRSTARFTFPLDCDLNFWILFFVN